MAAPSISSSGEYTPAIEATRNWLSTAVEENV
jgi:hypothetical protein